MWGSLRKVEVSGVVRRWRKRDIPMITETELVKRIGGGEGRGDASERSIRLRIPATKGSKEDTARLKSTRQAAK